MSLLASATLRARAMARKTLDAALALIDPVWGGMYQYSDAVDWKSPHFEKIMSVQADAIASTPRLRRLHQPRYLRAARDVARYVTTLLTSPDGALLHQPGRRPRRGIDGHHYYPLADEKRRALGIPRVDQHRYARECGWMITAWASLYQATRDRAVLKKAVRAAEWALRERALPGGGFAHQKDDPSLADNLAMAQGLTELARIDPRWKKDAAATFAFIGRAFADPRGGFFSVAVSPEARGVFAQASRSVEENAALARAAAHFAGDTAVQELARRAKQFADSEIDRPWVAPIIAADLAL